MSLILFYVPTPKTDIGEKIATTLLEENLIACANILPAHKALYRWEGKIEKDESEHIMILKTKESLAAKLEKRIKELHPYECPCIAQIKAANCNLEFLDWVHQQTQP